MGTAAVEEEVAWLNEGADDPRKKPNRHQPIDDAEDDDWTREYDVDQEIENHERRWESRLGQIDRICRVLDAVIALGLWGCSIFYYWIWFSSRHNDSSSTNHGAGKRQQQQQHLVHVAVVTASVLLGVLYCARGVGVCGLRIITGALVTIQIGLFIFLMLHRSFYVHQQHHHDHHGLLLFRALCVFSEMAIGSELVRLVLIMVIHRRRRLRRREMDGLQEPLLDGVEWQTRQQEWACRTEEDPLWWSREEEEEDDDDGGDEETFYSRTGRPSTMVESAGRERFS